LIKAAGVPFTIESIVTSYNQVDNQLDGKVLIQWTAPDSNFDAITSYDIQIYDKTGLNSYPDLVNCNGAAIRNTSCVIPMQTFTSAPFNLAFND